MDAQTLLDRLGAVIMETTAAGWPFKREDELRCVVHVILRDLQEHLRAQVAAANRAELVTTEDEYGVDALGVERIIGDPAWVHEEPEAEWQPPGNGSVEDMLKWLLDGIYDTNRRWPDSATPECKRRTLELCRWVHDREKEATDADAS